MPWIGTSVIVPGPIPTLSELAVTRPRVGLRLAGVQIVPSGSLDLVSWGVELYDVGGLWDPASPTIITVPLAGLYVVRAAVRLIDVANGFRQIRINNGDEGGGFVSLPPVPAGELWAAAAVAVIDRAVGETIDVSFQQTSGVDISLAATTQVDVYALP